VTPADREIRIGRWPRPANLLPIPSPVRDGRHAEERAIQGGGPCAAASFGSPQTPRCADFRRQGYPFPSLVDSARTKVAFVPPGEPARARFRQTPCPGPTTELGWSLMNFCQRPSQPLYGTRPRRRISLSSSLVENQDVGQSRIPVALGLRTVVGPRKLGVRRPSHPRPSGPHARALSSNPEDSAIDALRRTPAVAASCVRRANPSLPRRPFRRTVNRRLDGKSAGPKRSQVLPRSRVTCVPNSFTTANSIELVTLGRYVGSSAVRSYANPGFRSDIQAIDARTISPRVQRAIRRSPERPAAYLGKALRHRFQVAPWSRLRSGPCALRGKPRVRNDNELRAHIWTSCDRINERSPF